jgi:hypothetical protein
MVDDLRELEKAATCSDPQIQEIPERINKGRHLIYLGSINLRMG